MSVVTRDYNGVGPWAVPAVQARYREYAARYLVPEPILPEPKVYIRGDVKWVCPVMDAVILGIKRGDTACIVLGVEFIECDGKFAFGANLKARTARALKTASIPPTLAVRVRRRVADMLVANNTPQEFREYIRLLRRIGFEDIWPRISGASGGYNRYTSRYFAYLRQVRERSPAVCRPES